MAKEKGLSTKAGIFESGVKDIYGVDYKDDRLLSCRNKALTEYEVKDGTKVICDRAFYDLKNLEKVVLPASVEAIGEGSFSGCKTLKEINIPEGVTELKQGVFRDCDSLEELTLPESMKNIDKFAFDKGLKVLTILSPDAEIHRHALLNCKDLEKLMVPEGSEKHYRTILADARISAEVEEINESIFAEESFEEKDHDEKLEYPNLSIDEDTGQENENNDVKVFNISIHYLDDPDDLEGYETEFEGENLEEAIEYVKGLDDYDSFDYFVIESEDGNDYFNSSEGRSSEESQYFVQELNEKTSLSDNILESGESPLPKEFMTIRHFTGREDGENFIQSYPGLVKEVSITKMTTI